MLDLRHAYSQGAVILNAATAHNNCVIIILLLEPLVISIPHRVRSDQSKPNHLGLIRFLRATLRAWESILPAQMRLIPRTSDIMTSRVPRPNRGEKSHSREQ